MLLPQHAALIKASAISDEVAEARGYRSVDVKAELGEFGFGREQRRVPALVIPLHDVRGEIAGYLSRPDVPRMRKGRPSKYEFPSGSQTVLDVPPDSREQLGDPRVPLFITEGARKADAAVSRGLCCISLIGVWNWRGTNDHGGKALLADFESIALNDRTVYLVFDSDVMTKPEVHKALERLKAVLERHGAKIAVIYLPAGPRGAKVGLDDYFATGHSVDDVLAHASPELRSLPGTDGSRLYEETDDGIFWNKSHDQPVRLTNFTARIVSDVSRDDGVETTQTFEVEARLHGR